MEQKRKQLDEKFLVDDYPKTDSLKRRLVQGDRKKFEKYVTSTSTHGVKHIFTGKSKIRRAFWGFLFLFMAIACLQGIAQSIIFYVSTPSSTTVYTQHVTSLPFPAVTICNLNGLQIKYLTDNNLTDAVMSALYQDQTNDNEFGQQCRAQFESSLNEDDIISLAKVIKNGSHPLSELVVNCRFLGKPCNFSSMFIEYPTPLGNCYTFNGRNPNNDYLVVKGSGFRHDLELTVNIHQNEYIGSADREAGVLVSIHEQDVPALVFESGITVPVGHSAYLSVTQRQIEDRTNREDSDCLPHSQAPPLELFSAYNYSFQSCRGECILNDLIDKCQCVESVVSMTRPSGEEIQICNVSDLCCIFRVVDSLTSECDCQVLCNHTFYDVTPSYATFPGTNDYDRVMERFNISKDEIRENFLRVHVYFKELSIGREITEKSYSITALIADIGGQMGLFLGASVVSLTEFLTLIFDQLKDRLFGIREKRLKKAVGSFWAENKAKLHKGHANATFENDSFAADDDNVYVYGTDYRKNVNLRSNMIHGNIMLDNDLDNDGNLDITSTM